MKIGEVARRVGVSISALRMYEQRGLIEAVCTQGGTRHYDEENLERFRAIVTLTRADISIDALARLARIRLENATGNSASRQVEAALTEMEAEVQARLKLLESTYADLRLAKQRLAGCHGCRKKPTRLNCNGCAVADGLQECKVMRIVWDETDDV